MVFFFRLNLKAHLIIIFNNICFRQAPIGDDNYLHLAARAGFDSQLNRRAYETDGLNQRCIDAGLYDNGSGSIIRRNDDRKYDDLSSNRRYENDNNVLSRQYENHSDTLRSIQNDLNKFDRSLSNTLGSDKHERNANDNVENQRRINDVGSLLTSDGINLSDTFNRKLSNYDNTREFNDGSITRRIKDDVSDNISSSSISARGNH